MTKKVNFNELGLSASSIMAINEKGFETPTEIQALTIPLMLQDNSNIIAQAQTGTGKTAAFGLPLIELIDPGKKKVQALILVPTRELAIQVSEEIHSLNGEKKIRIMPIYGGQSIDQQFRRLRKGVHIVVGTPGRIIDHLKRRTLNIKSIEHLILDEADEMLNMGFIDDMEEIFEYTNNDKRTLLFSATMPDRIKSLATRYMKDYEFLKTKKHALTTHLTEQIYFEVKAADKFEALCRIIDFEDDFYGLVFCRTKNNVNSVVKKLCSRGYDAAAIHGDISQAQRERALEKFRQKQVNILIATDVAARGIDVNDLTHVINFSLPHDSDAYIHRIGRTGRAGKSGTAITFITPGEYKQFMLIQQETKTNIKKSELPQTEEVISDEKQKISDDIISLLDGIIEAGYYNWAKSLLEKNSASEIIAATLKYCFEDTANEQIDNKSTETEKKEKYLRNDGTQIDKEGKTRLFVALGKKQDMTPRKLVELITGRVAIQARQIIDVQVLSKFSFVTVPFEKAEEIIKSFKTKGQRPIFSIAKGK